MSIWSSSRLVFTILLLIAPASAAVAQDVFTVRGVEVDATADNVVQAQEIALAEGQRLAADRLFQRLVPAEYLGQVPALGAQSLDDLVQNVSVARERRSDVRYLADLTVGFRADAVRRLLREAGVPFAETPGRPVLVLPLYGPKGQAVLWQGENPWRDYWANRQGSGGLVPFVAPIGDLSDVVAIDAEAAAAGDIERLRAIAERYGAEDVIVARAYLEGEPKFLLVDSVLYRPDTPPASQGDEILEEPGEDLDDLFERAALRIEAPIQNAWRRENVLRFDSQASLLAEVPLTSLDDWVMVRDRLTQTAAVIEVTLRRLSRRQAIVEVSYVGDEDQLSRALALSKLDLKPKEGAAVWGGEGTTDQPAPWSGAATAVPSGGQGGTSGTAAPAPAQSTVPAQGTIPAGGAVAPASARLQPRYEIIRTDLAPAAPPDGSG